MLIDSHVNLHAPAYDADRAEVIARASASGIELMVNICDRLGNLAAVRAIADAHPAIWHTVGTHPHEAREAPDLDVADLVAAAAAPKAVAIGECGLDYHYDHSPRAVQRAVFAAHIGAARATGLPLVVHTREADDDMLAMLEAAWPWDGFRVLLHCYTSGPALAARAAEMGAWFSISGIATFKAAHEVRALIAAMPGDRILVETDCPYLAPVPLRGRRNEPAFLPHVLGQLAQTRGWSLADAEQRTEDAFFRLFDRIPRPAPSAERHP